MIAFDLKLFFAFYFRIYLYSAQITNYNYNKNIANTT